MLLHKAFLKKNPDRLLAMGTEILRKRLDADEIILHLARVAVEGTLIYTHNPRNRSLDIYEQKHVDMVPNYVNDYYRSAEKKPESLKTGKGHILLVPLITRNDERIGILEIRCKRRKKFKKVELEEIDYYSEAFVSIIDDYRKQKEHLGLMRDLTGLVILLIMWVMFFMSLSIIYAFSPQHYNIIFFVILFFILGGTFILFGEHLYTMKGWGIDFKGFLKDLPYYLGIAAVIVGSIAIFKWFGLFGIPRDLGGSFLPFQWTWRDIFYPISVPLQELAARVFPHTILNNVMKGWHKHITIVLVSSLVFGFGHISFGIIMVLWTFILGVILGAVFEMKKNFYGICLVHMIVGYLIMTGLGLDAMAALP